MSLVHDHHQQPFPKGALWVAGGMIGFALIATSAVRLGFMPVQSSPVALRAENHTAAVMSRDLRFSDRADGAVVIEDVVSKRIHSIIIPGQKTGFIRGIMRSMARERRIHGIGSVPPFRLTSWADGELSLVDMATGRSLELNSYGPTNRASFAALLTPESDTPRLATQ
jgi:putative photosynthetic complex assembly protein